MSSPTDKKALDDLCYKIIGCAIEVHHLMGPGLLERAYQECLQHEFGLQNVRYIRQCHFGLSYKGSMLDATYIADFLVEDQVIVEIKAVSEILPIHQAQLIS